MQRRTLLWSAMGFALRSTPSKRLPIKTAVEYNMLRESASIPEKFRIAKDAGFEQIECPTTRDASAAEQMKKAAEETKLPIHSVMNMDHWKYPLSSSDPAVVEKSLEGARISLRNAHLWGAQTVLIVPAVVNTETAYADAYKRSQENIRKLIPLAEELKVIIAIEEVWNKFLLSPLEFARYVDEFKSEWVRAYFDVGNVALYGYPQDWIRTLGKRIVKLHIKDFSFRRDSNRKLAAEWDGLGEGDLDWPAIYGALQEIGFRGTATVELEPGNPAYLKEVCRRLNSILEGQMAKGGESAHG